MVTIAPEIMRVRAAEEARAAVAAMKLLIDHGAEVNVADKFGETPLWTARNNKEAVELLEEHGRRKVPAAAAVGKSIRVMTSELNTSTVRSPSMYLSPFFSPNTPLQAEARGLYRGAINEA